MKTIQQILEFVRVSLEPSFSHSETKQISFALVGKVADMSLSQMLISKDTNLSDNQAKKIESFVERLKKGEPLQYIMGYADFCGLRFFVDKSTLIPRPETSELVDWIAEDCTVNGTQILDVGTGSGCIAISLKNKIPSAKITGVDISVEALEMAKKNAETNHLQVDFLRMDILAENQDFTEKFDVIVSNPPYICENEKKEMEKNVLDYEPHSALFVPDENPLLFYKAVADFAQTRLAAGGNLYFEINRKFGKEMTEMLKNAGFIDINLRKDFYGNDRMVKARLKS